MRSLGGLDCWRANARTECCRSKRTEGWGKGSLSRRGRISRCSTLGKKTRSIPNLGFGKTLGQGNSCARGDRSVPWGWGGGPKKVQAQLVPAAKTIGVPKRGSALGAVRNMKYRYFRSTLDPRPPTTWQLPDPSVLPRSCILAAKIPDDRTLRSTAMPDRVFSSSRWMAWNGDDVSLPIPLPSFAWVLSRV
jgi:hypothetical protein